MPIGMKRELTEKAKRMGMKGEQADRYIFGGLRRAGWKPGLRAGGRPIPQRVFEKLRREPAERERVTAPSPEGGMPEEPARRRRPIQAGGIPAYRERAEGIIRRRPIPQRLAEERPIPQRERPVPQGVDWEGARGKPRMRIGGGLIPQEIRERLLRRRGGAAGPTLPQGRMRTRMGFPRTLEEFRARMKMK
ncbi:MAG: hypothetical protein DDT19_02567 [Syntrophomonadaceae bacterium]|nr:hypothetical protein [Bacillota bacterium]